MGRAGDGRARPVVLTAVIRKLYTVEDDRPSLGVDVAGSTNGDETTLYLSYGPDEKGRREIRFAGAWREKDTTVTVSKILDAIEKHSVGRVRIDVAGLGKGPKDQIARALADTDVKVEEWRSADPANESKRFLNTKAEESWNLRAELESGLLRLPRSQALRSQIVKMRDEMNVKQQHKIIDPADSPDHFDGLLIVVAGPGRRVAGAGWLDYAAEQIEAIEERSRPKSREEIEREQNQEPTPARRERAA